MLRSQQPRRRAAVNSRRFMAMLPVYDRKDSTALLRCGISIWPISAAGQIRSFGDMSGRCLVCPKADTLGDL